MKVQEVGKEGMSAMIAGMTEGAVETGIEEEVVVVETETEEAAAAAVAVVETEEVKKKKLPVAGYRFPVHLKLKVSLLVSGNRKPVTNKLSYVTTEKIET